MLFGMINVCFPTSRFVSQNDFSPRVETNSADVTAGEQTQQLWNIPT